MCLRPQSWLVWPLGLMQLWLLCTLGWRPRKWTVAPERRTALTVKPQLHTARAV